MSWSECDFGEPPVGDLSIITGDDEVSMFTAAWTMNNLFEWWLPPAQRGENVVRPWVDGSYAVRRFVAETRRSIQLTISGEVDRNGVPYANWYDGMFQNLQYLAENVVDPTGSGNGTRGALLTAPDGSFYLGLVHVTGMEVSEMRPNARFCFATIDVTIPGGRLQPWTS